jgi:transcriptional regulator with XRE-family HTH domain
MTDDPTEFAAPTAFGELLALARRRRALNVREASRAAGISEGRWRQLELGYQQVASGVRIPARPRASTVRAVAKAVGLDLATAFRELGLPVPEDVLAESQVEIDPRSVAGEPDSAEPYLSRRTGPDLSDVTTDALLEELARRARANNPDADR